MRSLQHYHRRKRRRSQIRGVIFIFLFIHTGRMSCEHCAYYYYVWMRVCNIYTYAARLSDRTEAKEPKSPSRWPSFQALIAKARSIGRWAKQGAGAPECRSHTRPNNKTSYASARFSSLPTWYLEAPTKPPRATSDPLCISEAVCTRGKNQTPSSHSVRSSETDGLL